MTGMPAGSLSAEETLRYGRHLVMPEVGLEGQAKLKAARVLCVGIGGLGSPAALYLAAAGIGTLGLVDDDTVELSNLQRQVLYGSDQVGQDKLAVAKARLRALNPGVRIEAHPVRLDGDNALALVQDYDIILDGSDNFPTRYRVNDAGVLAGKPVVYGSVLRFDGQLSVFDAQRGPCYRCIFPRPPAEGSVPSCAEGGVLGVLPGLVGSLQALEVIKLVLGRGEPLLGRLLLIEGLATVFSTVTVDKDPACPMCGEERRIFTPGADFAVASGTESDAGPATGSDAGPGAQFCAETAAPIQRITATELARALEEPGTDLRVLDVRTPQERAIARFPAALELPLDELPGRLDELRRDQGWVISCHKGARAERACALLQDSGFERVQVLDGGIDAWAEQVDPDLPRYA